MYIIYFFFNLHVQVNANIMVEGIHKNHLIIPSTCMGESKQNIPREINKIMLKFFKDNEKTHISPQKQL